MCSISRSQAEVVDNTNILVQRRAVMTARTFYQRGQCLNLRSYTILKLSLLFVLAAALKREVFLRLLSFFILLRNQICTNSNSVQNGRRTLLISTSFSQQKVFFFSGKYSFKTLDDPQVSFLSSCILCSIQLFAKSSSPSV